MPYCTRCQRAIVCFRDDCSGTARSEFVQSLDCAHGGACTEALLKGTVSLGAGHDWLTIPVVRKGEADLWRFQLRPIASILLATRNFEGLHGDSRREMTGGNDDWALYYSHRNGQLDTHCGYLIFTRTTTRYAHGVLSRHPMTTPKCRQSKI